MNIQRDIESTVTVGDYANGDGAKLFMDSRGISVQTDSTARTNTMEWEVWFKVVAEAARHLDASRER